MAKGQTDRGARVSTLVPPPVPQAQQGVRVELRIPATSTSWRCGCHRHDVPGGADWPFGRFLVECIEDFLEDRVALLGRAHEGVCALRLYQPSARRVYQPAREKIRMAIANLRDIC